MRKSLAPIVLMLLALAGPVLAAPLDLAWWRDGRTQVLQLHQGGTAASPFDGSRQVPLGSLWKLFVYVYAIDSRTPTPDYRCRGRDPEEVYCCDAGQSIARDAALAKSCGLFFAPQRLMLSSDAWRSYWSGRLGATPAGDFAWLSDPARLTPATLVRLESLLRALGSVPAASRADAEAALLRVVLDGRGEGSARWFGSRLRVKTWSWREPSRDGHPGARIGGAAGWLADGTPIWFGGAGGSSNVFEQWAPKLAASLPPVGAADDGGCVVVDYFQRYPIRAVRGERG
ncbi:MAG: DUF2300 domain-containing protein, partial [Massilia sp.]